MIGETGEASLVRGEPFGGISRDLSGNNTLRAGEPRTWANRFDREAWLGT
jgi:hypothetical protein